MGYYTWYSLSVKNENEFPIEKQREASLQLAEKLKVRKNYEEYIKTSVYPFSWVSDDSMKWYEYNEDMLELSKNFPEAIFVLYGEGEEREDIWRAFYKDGAGVFQRAHFYYDPEPTF